jgi:hypothetical protein
MGWAKVSARPLCSELLRLMGLMGWWCMPHDMCVALQHAVQDCRGVVSDNRMERQQQLQTAPQSRRPAPPAGRPRCWPAWGSCMTRASTPRSWTWAILSRSSNVHDGKYSFVVDNTLAKVMMVTE